MREILRREFVLVWKSHGNRIGVPLKYAWQKEELNLPTGFGANRVNLYVADSTGNVLSNIGGYWPRSFLLSFLQIARTMNGRNRRGMFQTAIVELARLVQKTGDSRNKKGLLLLAHYYKRQMRRVPQHIRQWLRRDSQRLRFGGC